MCRTRALVTLGEFPAFPQPNLRQEGSTVHFYNIWGWFQCGIPSFLFDGRSAGLSGPMIRSIFEAIPLLPTADIRRHGQSLAAKAGTGHCECPTLPNVTSSYSKNSDLNKEGGYCTIPTNSAGGWSMTKKIRTGYAAAGPVTMTDVARQRP